MRIKVLTVRLKRHFKDYGYAKNKIYFNTFRVVRETNIINSISTCILLRGKNYDINIYFPRCDATFNNKFKNNNLFMNERYAKLFAYKLKIKVLKNN